jgi:hypothetical protein
MRTSLATLPALCVGAVSAVVLLLAAPVQSDPRPIQCGAPRSVRAALVRLYREHLHVVEGPRALLDFDPTDEQGPIRRLLCTLARTHEAIQRTTSTGAQNT